MKDKNDLGTRMQYAVNNDKDFVKILFHTNCAYYYTRSEKHLKNYVQIVK